MFFALSLIFYFICGSKTLVSLLSSACPSVSFTSVLNWFKERTPTPLIYSEHSDVITYFDNNQVLARNWHVRYNAKALVSVITSVIHIVPNIISHYQKIAELSPNNWLYNSNVTPQDLLHKITCFNDNCSKDFNTNHNKFTAERLNKVYQEHSDKTHDIIDHINDEDN